MKKEIGIIGLGKMGKGLVSQWKKKGWEVHGYDKNGIGEIKTIPDLVKKFTSQKIIWLMSPHHAVDNILEELIPLLKKGDTVIDGGNSFFQDSIRRSKILKKKGINFLDVGVSGGPNGAKNGACVMVGGAEKMFKIHKQVFTDVSLKSGCLYVGPNGAGHFVKMIHNGIEYGMMQAIGEGFELLNKKRIDGKKLNVAKIAKLYNSGSVIASSLVGWLVDGYRKFGANLQKCSTVVGHSGEGQWTVTTAKKMNIPVPVIESSLNFRKRSKTKPSYNGRVLSAMRNMFGGHNVALKK